MKESVLLPWESGPMGGWDGQWDCHSAVTSPESWSPLLPFWHLSALLPPPKTNGLTRSTHPSSSSPEAVRSATERKSKQNKKQSSQLLFSNFKFYRYFFKILGKSPKITWHTLWVQVWFWCQSPSLRALWVQCSLGSSHYRQPVQGLQSVLRLWSQGLLSTTTWRFCYLEVSVFSSINWKKFSKLLSWGLISKQETGSEDLERERHISFRADKVFWVNSASLHLLQTCNFRTKHGQWAGACGWGPLGGTSEWGDTEERHRYKCKPSFQEESVLKQTACSRSCRLVFF